MHESAVLIRTACRPSPSGYCRWCIFCCHLSPMRTTMQVWRVTSTADVGRLNLGLRSCAYLYRLEKSPVCPSSQRLTCTQLRAACSCQPLCSNCLRRLKDTLQFSRCRTYMCLRSMLLVHHDDPAACCNHASFAYDERGHAACATRFPKLANGSNSKPNLHRVRSAAVLDLTANGSSAAFDQYPNDLPSQTDK